ncbi:uncharacterized protein LOC128549814 [Mercenaria mercenaria]|uniref:uncharacterized protein LOC128549814 n=1 Tax=Mercenaria mercenaria TaxID=6596 RepID=UPI00234E6339|nr:uncharacterized protein LOC128549814 [Mercenaria mercenaria]
MAFVVFGDSYVSRLEKYVKNHPFDLNDSEVKFYGVPGMSTVRKFHDKFQIMLADKPNYLRKYYYHFRFVFVNLGGNDINSSCNPQQIFENIVTIVKQLKNAGVEHVFVASIVERGSFLSWTGCNSNMFNKVRRSINCKLSVKFKEHYVDVGKKLRKIKIPKTL